VGVAEEQQRRLAGSLSREVEDGPVLVSQRERQSRLRIDQIRAGIGTAGRGHRRHRSAPVGRWAAAAASDEGHDQQVQFLGIDTQDDPAAAAAFIADLGIEYPPVIMSRSILMNEITIVGNVTADPILRKSGNGRGVIRFDLAVNRQRFHRETNQYEDLPPVFHRVVAFGPIAKNAAETLRKGLEVVVVGQTTDDSYETDTGEKRRQVVIEAQVIAPSLRFAKANVIRVQREQPAPEPEGQ
jgi:single-strand DNA-binding protein